VLVTNGVGTLVSSNAVLTVNPAPTPPVVLAAPKNLAAYVGQAATFTIQAQGNPAPTYQWKLNGNPLSGQTTTQLALAGLTTNSSGLYTVVIANAPIVVNPATLPRVRLNQGYADMQGKPQGTPDTTPVPATLPPSRSYQATILDSALRSSLAERAPASVARMKDNRAGVTTNSLRKAQPKPWQRVSTGVDAGLSDSFSRKAMAAMFSAAPGRGAAQASAAAIRKLRRNEPDKKCMTSKKMNRK
jgi:hypothetical protein